MSLSSFYDWLPWIVGGFSTITIIGILVALFVAREAVGVILKGVAEALVEFCKVIWEGFMDMTDNGKSILFVAIIAALSSAGTYYTVKNDIKAKVYKELHQDYKFVPRKKSRWF